MNDKEKLGAISIEIGIVDDRLDSFENWQAYEAFTIIKNEFSGIF